MHIPDPIRQGLGQIRDGDLAIVLHEGQVHVIFKVPFAAFQVLKLPPQIRHFLFLAPMPTAPIIGWFFEIQDDPENPVRLNALFNVRDPIQGEILVQLPHQTGMPFHLVDGETTTIAGSTPIRPPFNAAKIYAGALSFATQIGAGYNYDAAKARFEADYPIDKVATWLPS